MAAKSPKDVNRSLHLDLRGWLEGKTLVYIDTLPWRDFTTQEELGVKHTVQVVKDETEYPNPSTTNLGVQLTVKERGKTLEQVHMAAFETVVTIDEIEKATAYHPNNGPTWDFSIIAKLNPIKHQKDA